MENERKRIVVLLLAVFSCLLAFTSFAEGAVKRVTVNGGIAPRDGDSWEKAFSVEDFRINHAMMPVDTEFWLAAGVYAPGAAGNRDAAFYLASGTSIYGGFAGNEVTRGQRNPRANITVLTGDIDENDTRDGNGVTTAINGNNSYTVVVAENVNSTAILDGVVITGGDASNSGGTEFQKNGGGMYAVNSSAVIRNSSFIGNFADSRGGGIFGSISGSRVTNCYFSGNTSGRGGGMHLVDSDEMVLEDCTFSDNLGLYRAGGLSLRNSDVRVSSSTFSGNRAFDGASWGDGGGLFTELSSPVLTNCTFSGNRAYYGGGMYNDGQAAKVINCTFSGNAADVGSGLRVYNGTPEVKNCIFWNDGGGNEIVENSAVAVVTRSVVRGGFPSGSSIITADPKLGPLADNGGLTLTHALLPGSSALDRGTSAGAPSTDQRGVSRPQGSGYDIGAYELAVSSGGGGGGCGIWGTPFPGVLLLILPMFLIIRK